VLRGRGGYCFEQNALFEAALRALGFAVRPLLARVWLENPQETPPATHQLELVEIDGADWIADAGFGGSFTPPMPLAEGEGPAAPDGALHRLRRDERFGWMLERRGPVAPADGRAGEAPEWQRQYSFTTAPAYPADLATSNHWTSTRPGTRFTSLVVASQVTEDGFVSLTNRALRISGGADKGDVLLEDAQALRQALRTHFGIALDEDEAETLFARGRG
ncbi:MAG: arylamine N-acetyltransferase, partial [Sphingobium sp.]